MGRPLGVDELIEPEAYLRALQEGHQRLAGNLAMFVVDYELTEASPEMEEGAREVELERLVRVVRDLKWRIGELDRRIQAAQDGARGRLQPVGGEGG